MDTKIGVMQGRLLPKYKGRYQAHPLDYWQNEFKIASDLNLYSIEFILDYNDFHKNPLMSLKGLDLIKKNIDENQVYVDSICADIFMEIPFHKKEKGDKKTNRMIFKWLLKNCKSIGVKDIVVPCVDHSSIKGEHEMIEFINNINPLIEISEKNNINICLETDLDPISFSNLISEFNSKNITVNYDTGNSASLGYDIEEEFKYYGDRISDIHIKDRIVNGKSVCLGEGNVDFNKFFKVLKKINYKSAFIMQAYRDEEGINIFKKQKSFFIDQITKHEYNCNNFS